MGVGGCQTVSLCSLHLELGPSSGQGRPILQEREMFFSDPLCPCSCLSAPFLNLVPKNDDVKESSLIFQTEGSQETAPGGHHLFSWGSFFVPLPLSFL